MNAVRKNILHLIPPYMDFAQHKDLIAFTVGSEYLNYDDVTDTVLEADFDELVVVVEKDWLFDYMRADGIENPRNYLQEVYTWDDSLDWFWEAVWEKKIVTFSFD